MEAQRYVRVGDVDGVLFSFDVEHLFVDGLLDRRDELGHALDHVVGGGNSFEQTQSVFGDAFDPPGQSDVTMVTMVTNQNQKRYEPANSLEDGLLVFASICAKKTPVLEMPKHLISRFRASSDISVHLSPPANTGLTCEVLNLERDLLNSWSVSDG